MKPFKDIFLKSANTKDAEPQKKQKKKNPQNSCRQIQFEKQR